MFLFTDDYNNNEFNDATISESKMDALFLKHDMSTKNKGAKIPLSERKNVMRKFFSKMYNLEDIPKQAAQLFSGNSSRLKHVLFNDLTSTFDPDMNVGVKQLILDYVQKISKNKKKRICICQESN